MRFHKNLYIGASIRHPERVKWKLRVAAGQINVHVIVISENQTNQLEIFHNAWLKQKYIHNKKWYVVGIAGDYAEAVNLVARMTQDCLDATQTADIKAFLYNTDA